MQAQTFNPDSPPLPQLGAARFRFAAFLWIIFGLAAGASAQTNVVTYHYDNARTGQNTNETILTPANVNSSQFGKLFSYSVDGYVYAQPLYLPGVNIPGKGGHNVVFVATEHDSVYAFDADSNAGANAVPLWQITLLDAAHGAAAGATSVPYLDLNTTDIVPEVGITSTPVIDTITGTIYVFGKTKENGNYVQRLHALDITTGAEKTSLNSPVTIQASVPGNGSGSTAGTLNWDPQWQNQRLSLLLLNGVIYLGFGSHGDNANYHGWILSYSAATLQQLGAYCATPNGLASGIWMSGAGLASDGADIFLATGNGTFDALNPPYNATMDFGDDIIRLGSTGGQLTPKDSFTPFNQDALNIFDQDQGSGGVLLLPDQSSGGHPHLLLQAGKEGKIYLLDRDNLGGYCNGCSSNPNALQEIPNAVGGMWSMPAYWNNTLYFWGGGDAGQAGDVLKAFSLSNGRLSTLPISRSSDVYNFPGATPTISANGSTNGIVWSIKSDTYATSGPAVLRAHDAGNVATMLYSSDQNSTRDNPGPSVKFSVPTVIYGKVYVGTEKQLSVFGLLNGQQLAATPIFSPAGQLFIGSISISLSDTTAGATIFYTTDGSMPTTASTRYTGPIIRTSTTTINAMATATSFLQSPVATAIYTLQTQTSIPAFNPVPGSYTSVQSVALSDTTAGASIFYTINGSLPTTSSTPYTAPIPVAMTTTIKAIASASGLSNSPVASGTYAINLPPPTLGNLQPDLGILGIPTTVTLPGTNFVPGNTTINNSYAGLTITNVTVNSSTSMTATFTAAANAQVGTAFISVTTPGGTSGAQNFEVYGVPILNSISPTSGAPGSSFTATLTGSRLKFGQIQFSGTGITVSNRTLNSPLFTILTYTFTIASNAPTGPQSITVINLAGTSAPVTFTITGGTPAPTLASINPSSGATGQVLNNVTLMGTNLTGATINTPSGITASAVSSTATSVTATFTIAANAPTGAQNVTVTTAGGPSNAVTFTVNQAPAITSANNATFTVGTAGSFTVTATGSPTPSLTETGALPSGVTFVANLNGTGTLSGTPATGTGGVYNLSLTAANGVGSNSIQSFTLTVNAAPPPAPVLSTISPSSGQQGQTINNLTLTGSNLSGATINALSGITISNVAASASQVTATFAIASNATLGARNVTVTTTGGTSNTLTFTVNAAPPPPTLGNLQPDLGILGIPTTITLPGTNFVPGNTTINNSYAGLTISNVTVNSSISMTATFTAAANAQVGTAFISVTTPGGTSGTENFEVYGVPILNSVSPASGAPGSSFTATLTGSRLKFGQIQFSGTGITVSNRTLNSPLFTILTYTFTIASNAPTGPQSITVTNPAGTSAPVTFTITGGTPAPTLTNINPSSGATGQVLNNVTLTGTNLTGATINTPTGITASGVSSTATSVTATFTIAANAPTGAQNVSVTTTGGASNALTFTVNQAPAIASANNATFVVGTAGSFTVTATGSPTPSLTETGALPSGVTFVANLNGTGTLSGTPGTGTGGVYNLSLTAANGVGSNAVQIFTLTVNAVPPPAPTLSTINPSSGQQGQVINPVTLTGTNLTGATINALSGITISNVAASASQITATFTIASNATLGARNVTVTTSGGTSNTLTFTVNAAPPPPTLSLLNPETGILGTATTVTLTGTNYVSGNTTVNGSYAGLTITNVTVNSSTSMTATFTLTANAQVGTASISVTTPGGTSGTQGFEIIGVPILNSISPASGARGTSFTVTLTGSRLKFGSILFSGTGITVTNGTLNSPLFTILTYTFTIASNAPTGPQSITVTNLAGTSAPLTFTVQ